MNPNSVGLQITNILGNLKRRSFGSHKVAAEQVNPDGMRECVICMEDYKESDEVAELKCD
jgi:hypothetical protein